MSTHQNPIPDPHTRTSKIISKDREGRTIYIEDLAWKIFVQELLLSTPEELSCKHQCGASPGSQ